MDVTFEKDWFNFMLNLLELQGRWLRVPAALCQEQCRSRHWDFCCAASRVHPYNTLVWSCGK